MIFFRTADGKRVQVEGVAVEICSADGMPAIVVVDLGESHLLTRSGEKEFEEYCKTFGLGAAAVVTLA